MIIADFHNHTSFSSDSTAAPETMIERAIALGLKILCITDHMDYLFPEQYDYTFVFNPEDYFTKLNTLKDKYAGQIDLRIGIELGLRNEPDKIQPCADYYHMLAEKYPFDFLIGSTHVLENVDPYYPEYWEGRTKEDGMRAYFESILENSKNFDMFQVYGHLDYLIRYVPGDDHTYKYADYADLIDEILKLLITQGRGIELNTAGYKYGLGFAHPHPDILTRYRELGGEILTIGSDGHAPEHLAYDFAKAEELLKALGFRYYTIFNERKPEFIKL